jgi:hypothetical protein
LIRARPVYLQYAGLSAHQPASESARAPDSLNVFIKSPHCADALLMADALSMDWSEFSGYQ